MTIKIYGNNGLGPIQQIKHGKKAQSSSQAESQSTDRVQFSSVINETLRAREAAPTQESWRSEKLQSLKEQIAEGSYKPDANKVAASLLKFLAESQS